MIKTGAIGSCFFVVICRLVDILCRTADIWGLPHALQAKKMGYPKTIKMIRDPDFFYTGQKNQGYF
ncbi:hypothetical protein CN373_02635 [Bacillus cereus]|nr:hypothetical protein CN373_02635 [Bacillus cereus]PFR30966.1 hypothetical protein COK19_03585 [Bacillus cereus]PGZ18761.1 hypothetical protein COE46_06050 [Bacillus cereus]